MTRDLAAIIAALCIFAAVLCDAATWPARCTASSPHGEKIAGVMLIAGCP